MAIALKENSFFDYLLPITYYLLPITYYLLLITYYLLHQMPA
jgi:hypothetical protein